MVQRSDADRVTEAWVVVRIAADHAQEAYAQFLRDATPEARERWLAAFDAHISALDAYIAALKNLTEPRR